MGNKLSRNTIVPCGNKSSSIRPAGVEETTTSAPVGDSEIQLFRLLDRAAELGENSEADKVIVIVVGQQSGAKSTVLQHLIGFRVLETGGGRTVTKCPIVLKVRYNKSVEVMRATIETSNGTPGASDLGPQDVLPRLAEITDRLVPDGSDVTDDFITITLETRHRPNLCVVDLPGLIQLSDGGKREKIEEMNRDFLKKHPKATILAVGDASQDTDNLSSISFLEKLVEEKHLDPEVWKRTMLLLTKADTASNPATKASLLETVARGRLRSHQFGAGVGLCGFLQDTDKKEEGAFLDDLRREADTLTKRMCARNETAAGNAGLKTLIDKIRRFQFTVGSEVVAEVVEQCKLHLEALRVERDAAQNAHASISKTATRVLGKLEAMLLSALDGTTSRGERDVRVLSAKFHEVLHQTAASQEAFVKVITKACIDHASSAEYLETCKISWETAYKGGMLDRTGLIRDVTGPIADQAIAAVNAWTKGHSFYDPASLMTAIDAAVTEILNGSKTVSSQTVPMKALILDLLRDRVQEATGPFLSSLNKTAMYFFREPITEAYSVPPSTTRRTRGEGGPPGGEALALEEGGVEETKADPETVRMTRLVGEATDELDAVVAVFLAAAAEGQSKGDDGTDRKTNNDRKGSGSKTKTNKTNKTNSNGDGDGDGDGPVPQAVVAALQKLKIINDGLKSTVTRPASSVGSEPAGRPGTGDVTEALLEEAPEVLRAALTSAESPKDVQELVLKQLKRFEKKALELAGTLPHLAHDVLARVATIPGELVDSDSDALTKKTRELAEAVSGDLERLSTQVSLAEDACTSLEEELQAFQRENVSAYMPH